MPNYDFACNACQHMWEQQLPIARRDEPLTLPCPNCHTTVDTFFREANDAYQEVIERLVAAPGVSYTSEHVRPKTSEGFKDVLRNIKKAHIGSTINV